MKSQSTPPSWIEDAPELFTDRDRLWLAMRAAIASKDIPRYKALKERDDVLRAEWRAQNPEKVAELKREQQDEEDWCNYADTELKKADPEAARMMMLLSCKSAKASNHALEMITERDIANAKTKRAENKAESLENRFGLPHGQADFTPPQLYKIAQSNGYEAKMGAFYHALRVRDYRQGERIPAKQAEEVLSDVLSKQRPRRAI